MKDLNDFLRDEQTALLKKHGVFFAFSDKQFEEGKKEGVEYRGLGNGTVCPKDNCKAFTDDHNLLVDNAIKQDIKENGIDAIILRELLNHECYYTGSIEDTVSALNGYPIGIMAITKVFNKNYNEYSEC